MKFGSDGREPHQPKPWTQAGWFHLTAHKAVLRAALAEHVTSGFCSYFFGRSRELVDGDIKHTSVYLPEPAYEALRQVAFDERRKIHDLLIEGVELALKKRGYPALADMKAKSQRKER